MRKMQKKLNLVYNFRRESLLFFFEQQFFLFHPLYHQLQPADFGA